MEIWSAIFAYVPGVPTYVLLHVSHVLHFYSLFRSGNTKVVLYPEVYSLERVSEGLNAIEQRKTWGKAVVRVRNDDGSSFVEKGQGNRAKL